GDADNQGRGLVRLWDVARGELVREFEGHQLGILGLAFAPDGRTLAVSHFNGVAVWSVPTARKLRDLGDYTYRMGRIAFAPDGRLAALSADGALRLWDPATGRERRFAGPAGVFLAFAADGRTLFAMNTGRTVGQWETATGGLRRSLAGPRD